VRGLGAAALAALARAGELSASEIAQGLLANLTVDRNRAWQAIDPDDLLAQARDLDSRGVVERAKLPLFAVPVGVKDAFDTEGLPTTYGSPIYAGHRPRRDAAFVARLRAGGALIAGKTKCTEFSWMTATDTCNPIAPGRTPGGSSSGSAAAVADGEVPLATATQTAGSTIRPGSYCGVLAYKPTFATFPREGVYQLSPALDTVGVIARSVEDLRLVAGLPAAGERCEDPRIAFVRTPWWQSIETDARFAIERALTGLQASDVAVSELELPELEELADAQLTVQLVESASSLGVELDAHPELLSQAIREAIVTGRQIPAQRYRRAIISRDAHAVPLEASLAAYDAIITPSAHGTPPRGLDQTGDPLFCRPWTLMGLPCVAVPLAWTPDRLPVGLQLTGPRGSDARLLATAEALLERCTNVL
jgi:amidase